MYIIKYIFPKVIMFIGCWTYPLILNTYGVFHIASHIDIALQTIATISDNFRVTNQEKKQRTATKTLQISLKKGSLPR